MSVSHLFSAALCFVVSAGRVTPESEISYALAHCDSPALSPVGKEKKEKTQSHMPSALRYSSESTMLFNFSGHGVFSYFLGTAASTLKTSVLRSSVWHQLVLCWGSRSYAPAMMSNMLGQLEKWRSVLFSIVYVWERRPESQKSQHTHSAHGSILCYLSALQPDLTWVAPTFSRLPPV